MRRDWDDIKQLAIAIVAKRPGINSDSLARAVGLDLYTESQNRTHEDQRLIAALAKESSVVIKRNGRATDSDPCQVYPVDYQFSNRPLSQSGTDFKRSACKTYVDPTLVGSWTPQTKARDEIEEWPVEPHKPFRLKVKVATPSTPIEEKEPAMSESEPLPIPSVEPDPPAKKGKDPDARQKLETALNELIEVGEPFKLVDLTSWAGVADATIYKHPDLKAKAVEAIAKFNSPLRSVEEARAKCMAVLTELIGAAQPFLQADVQRKADLHASFWQRHKDLHELVKQAAKASQPQSVNSEQARIEELEQRNRELRMQIAASVQPQPQPQPIVQLAPIDWLSGECQHWELQVEQTKAEVARIMQVYTAAQENLLCYQRLLRLHEAEVSGPEPSSNGNGHKAEVTA